MKILCNEECNFRIDGQCGKLDGCKHLEEAGLKKIYDAQEKIARVILSMSPEVFYNFCFDIEYYDMNYGFDIFDCAKCNELYGCHQKHNNSRCNMCFDKFMEYYEVGKYETK